MIAECRLIPGNWEEFDSFCWHDEPDDSADYALVYTNNRDSDLIDESNAAAIENALAEFVESGDVIPQHHSHWAVGWVDGYAIRVYRDGELTPAAQVYCDLLERLEDYPILDESDYSERELEAQNEAFDNWARSDLERELSKKFGYDVESISGELFSTLADRANVYWETDGSGVTIAIERIADVATLDDIAEFVAPLSIRVFRAGSWFINAVFHCGRIENFPLIYSRELEQIESAIENENDSALIDGILYTWEIN